MSILLMEQEYLQALGVIDKRNDYIDSLPEKTVFTVKITKDEYGRDKSRAVGNIVKVIKIDKDYNWWCLYEDKRKKEGNRLVDPEHFTIIEDNKER